MTIHTGQCTLNRPFTAFRSHWREFIEPTLLSSGGTLIVLFSSVLMVLFEVFMSSYKLTSSCLLSFLYRPPCLYSRGGHFGRLEIVYSTSETDIVGMAQADGQNLLMYYNLPKPGVPSAAPLRTVNITGQGDPPAACAAACLREPACQAFSLSSAVTSTSCTWVTSGVDQLTSKSQVMTYVKNITAAAVLFSAQAVAGSDYTPVTAQRAVMEDGSRVANLTVPILTDTFPEMDESFSIQILKVKKPVLYMVYFVFHALCLNCITNAVFYLVLF